MDETIRKYNLYFLLRLEPSNRKTMRMGMEYTDPLLVTSLIDQLSKNI